MAKLKFDELVDRRFQTGVAECVLYPKPGVEYDTGVAWNGITNIEENPSGAEEQAYYADNIKYVSMRSKEEYGCTINAYTYPDEWAACDGSSQLAVGIMAGQQSRIPFGLVYKTKLGNEVQKENYGELIHIVYNSTASVSSKSYQTINENPELIEFSWETKATPITVEGVSGIKNLSTITIDTTKFVDTEGKAKLKAILDALYGTDAAGEVEGTEPKLLSPEEIYDIMFPQPVPPNENIY